MIPGFGPSTPGRRIPAEREMTESPVPIGNPSRFSCDHSAQRALSDDGIVRATGERLSRLRY